MLLRVLRRRPSDVAGVTATLNGSFASAMRQASRYSIGASPTARLKRAKNAERESAASFANSATVHVRVGCSRMARMAAAAAGVRQRRRVRCDPGPPAC